MTAMNSASARRVPPTQASRARQKAIVDAVLEVLCEAGVAGISTRKVAQRAGLHLGSLHYAFGTKDEMLFTALEAITEEVRAVLSEAVNGAQSLEEALERAQEAYWHHVEQTPALQRVQYELTTYDVHHPHAADLAASQYATYREAIEEVLTAVVGRSGERLALPIAELARLTLAGFDGVIIQYLADGDSQAARKTLALQRAALLKLTLA